MANPSVASETTTLHHAGDEPASPPRGRWIRPTTALGVFGLAAAAFVLSYDALHALALAAGIRPGLAWIWPLVVDGFIGVASLSVLAASRHGRPTAYPWTLVGLFSALSIGFNIAHAPDVLTAQAVAAIPPLALMLAFELLMRQVPTTTRHDSVTARPHPTTDPAQTRTDPTDAAVPADPDPANPGGPTSLAGQDPAATRPIRDQARQVYAERLTAGQPATGAALARALGISERYGQRLLAELRAETPAGDPTSNGYATNPTTRTGATASGAEHMRREEANGR